MRRAICFAACATAIGSVAAIAQIEVSADGRLVVDLAQVTDAPIAPRGTDVPYPAAPDWQNTLRRQVGALQCADMNNDGWVDVVVGCYISSSFPPYTDWENLIYYNTGSGQLEANPSWVSADEVSTGDIQIGDINGDTWLDIFSANGGSTMSPSVVYYGSPTGPSTTPGWTANVPGRTWTNSATLADFDGDGDLDVMTANQGNSQADPYRPMFLYRNINGTLETNPSWRSDETSIQGWVAAGDFNNDDRPDVAVSKWVNFESAIYENVNGELQTAPAITFGGISSKRCVDWADVDDDGWLDLAHGNSPTELLHNENDSFTVSWTAIAPFYSHQDMKFADVDHDGDPDLAETHFGDGRARIYLNRDGTLDQMPSWTYDSPTVGTAIAFGDINLDGWLDLVVGNSGEPSVKLFLAVPPPCVTDLNGDRQTDLVDLALLLSNFGLTGENLVGDLNGNGEVELSDLATLLAVFGTAC
ncbi:MAG: FG-GAP-like repeat-containing protein [Phycisphaerae bacterium]